MRKSLIDTPSVGSKGQEGSWLNLPELASVQITSEADGYPIESALSGEETTGWRASQTGEQIIRISFDRPLPLRRIRLRFVETGQTRTQEFVLRCRKSDGALQEIVRQQWNFSPDGSTSETEDYQVELSDVSVLELSIRPDLSGGAAIASLSSLQIA